MDSYSFQMDFWISNKMISNRERRCNYKSTRVFEDSA